MKVYKYPMPLNDKFVIRMPEGAKPLCVQLQRGEPCIWVAVDPMEPECDHIFMLCGTGHERNDIAINEYIGTFQIHDLVFHLFDGGEPAF